MFFDDAQKSLKAAAANDLSLVGLKASIIVVALIFIGAALAINNKLALAAMLVYILMP
jgi:hypothetical protein